MANHISYTVRKDLPDVQMSNGLTAVVFSVLAINASLLAADDIERRFAIWLAGRDQ